LFIFLLIHIPLKWYSLDKTKWAVKALYSFCHTLQKVFLLPHTAEGHFVEYRAHFVCGPIFHLSDISWAQEISLKWNMNPKKYHGQNKQKEYRPFTAHKVGCEGPVFLLLVLSKEYHLNGIWIKRNMNEHRKQSGLWRPCIPSATHCRRTLCFAQEILLKWNMNPKKHHGQNKVCPVFLHWKNTGLWVILLSHIPF